MANLKKRMTLINAIVDAFLKPADTVDYPYGELVLPEGYRGAVVIDAEKCTGCGLCVRDCPAEALELEKDSRTSFKLIHYPARCAYCGECELSCRTGAISLSNVLVGPTDDPQGWVVVLKDETGEEDEE